MIEEKLKFLNISFSRNAPLFQYTTFQLGGPCPLFIECQSPQQLKQAISLCQELQLEFILLGEGSNIVVSDQGLNCTVIRYLSPSPIINRTGDRLRASASTLLDDLVLYAAHEGLSGINYASGIPGTVGGAVVGNAGAFGQQIGEAVVSVALMDKSGVETLMTKDECGFSYRHSQLKDAAHFLTEVTFQLTPDNKKKLLMERDQIISLRHSKHPDYKRVPCAGSFFKNLEPNAPGDQRTAAGWFLEQAGAKELVVGGAGIFEKHANIIIKSLPQCTAQDVFELSEKMAELVKNQFDIQLKREVRFLGFFKGNIGSECFW